MKKVTIILSLVLSLALMLAFAGCGDDKKDAGSAVQSAVSQIVSDANQITAPSLDTESEEEPAEETIVGVWKGDMEVSEDEKLPMTCEFKDDGTYTMGFDKEDIKEYCEDLLEKEADDMGMTTDEILDMLEMSLDDYIDQTFESLGDTSIEGNYKEENGQLYITESLSNTDFEESADYELSGDTLTLDMDGDTLVLTRS